MQWITLKCGYTYKNTTTFNLWRKELLQQIKKSEHLRQQAQDKVKRLKKVIIRYLRKYNEH